MDPTAVQPADFAPILWVGAIGVIGALAFVAYLRAQIRGAVGAVRHGARPTMSGRRVQLGIAVIALAALVWLDPALRAPAAVALGGAIAVALLRPGFEDSAYGDSGVQRGWFARRFEDLEEWRLTGQHLRWKLYGEWLASEVPTSEHAELRARLEKLVPDRESRFKH